MLRFLGLAALFAAAPAAWAANPPAFSSAPAPSPWSNPIFSTAPAPSVPAVAPSTPPATSVTPPAVPNPIYGPPTVVLSTAPDFGPRLPASNGPWVLGDVKFYGARTVSDYALRSKVRAKRGSLYTPNDIAGDVASLLELNLFSGVNWGLFATDEPVPPQYMGIVVSTTMARLVFFVEEKGAPLQPVRVSTTTRPEDRVPPAAVSGVIFTPTAYRGIGRFNRPGIGLDFSGVYYIGRLYGKNTYSYTVDKTNYLDRIGQWFFTADGKMQLQSEATYRPAVAVGVQAIYAFKDAPAPNLTTTSGGGGSPSVTIDVKKNRALADAYFVASKKFGPVRSSIGFMAGNFPSAIANLSEFLSPQALNFTGHPNQTADAKSAFFCSLLALPRPAFPVAVEFIKPTGMAASPILLNFKLGYFLHLNFDIAYMKYQGAWDLLGMFQFRYNYFPSAPASPAR